MLAYAAGDGGVLGLAPPKVAEASRRMKRGLRQKNRGTFGGHVLACTCMCVRAHVYIRMCACVCVCVCQGVKYELVEYGILGLQRKTRKGNRPEQSVEKRSLGICYNVTPPHM